MTINSFSDDCAYPSRVLCHSFKKRQGLFSTGSMKTARLLLYAKCSENTTACKSVPRHVKAHKGKVCKSTHKCAKARISVQKHA